MIKEKRHKHTQKWMAWLKFVANRFVLILGIIIIQPDNDFKKKCINTIRKECNELSLLKIIWF